VVREIHAPPLSWLFQRSSQHYSSDSEVTSTVPIVLGHFFVILELFNVIFV
jgi:hypothetical protein